MLTPEQQEYLETIWSDPKYSAAFSGPQKLYQWVKKEGKYKIGLATIRQFLADKDAYSLQKRVQRKFKRRRVIVQGIESQWDGDLMDVKNIAKYNDGVKYILVLQDVFSRFIFTEPMKDKTALATKKALKSVFDMNKRKPKILRFDKGSEIRNRIVTNFLIDEGVHLVFTQNETKSNYAERAIQTLKSRMYRMFMEKNSSHYIDSLSDITKGVNDTPSRPLGEIVPSSVNKSNEDEVRLKSYLVRTKTKLVPEIKKSPKKTKLKSNKRKKRSVYKFKVDDRVRITHLKHPFQRDYDQKWTGEIFVVTNRFINQGIPIYRLNDITNDPISGTFYTQELQKVNKGDDVT